MLFSSSPHSTLCTLTSSASILLFVVLACHFGFRFGFFSFLLRTRCAELNGPNERPLLQVTGCYRGEPIKSRRCRIVWTVMGTNLATALQIVCSVMTYINWLKALSTSDYGFEVNKAPSLSRNIFICLPSIYAILCTPQASIIRAHKTQSRFQSSPLVLGSQAAGHYRSVYFVMYLC